MPHKLDFIVFGVPHSGTKALARGLSLHPHVYCALERFQHHTDHSRLSFPDSFLEKSDISDRHNLRKLERLKGGLAGKTDVIYAGNKYARYYFALARINAELPELKNVWIYRSPFSFMQSWNRKEADHRTVRWRAGQVGLFGLLELLCCIDACTRLDKDVFVFPHQAGLTQSAEPILQALDFLGADLAAFDPAAFEAKLLPKRREGGHRLPLLSHEEELLDALHVRDLDRIIDRQRGVLLSQVRDDLKAYLASIADPLPKAVDRAFLAYGDDAVLSYGTAFFARHRQELAGLVRMTRGSDVIADLQRFGPLRRLKALYVQRWALKQRLASVRLPGLS